MSQMALGLLCATFVCWGVLGALFVRMHERVFLKMVAAEPVAEELQQQFFSTNSLTPVLYPTMSLKIMHIYKDLC